MIVQLKEPPSFFDKVKAWWLEISLRRGYPPCKLTNSAVAKERFLFVDPFEPPADGSAKKDWKRFSKQIDELWMDSIGG